MSPVTAEERIEWSTRLAQSLVQDGYDTEANLAPLVAEARATGQNLASLLIRRRLAIPGVVVGSLARMAQLPAIDLAAMTPSPDAIAAMPSAVGHEDGAVALQLDGGVLAVAFGEPPSPQDVETLASSIGHRVSPVLADPVLIAWYLEADDRPAGRPPGPIPASPLVDPNSDSRSESSAPTREQLLEEGIPATATRGDVPLHIDDLLRYAVSVGASDLDRKSTRLN